VPVIELDPSAPAEANPARHNGHVRIAERPPNPERVAEGRRRRSSRAVQRYLFAPLAVVGVALLAYLAGVPFGPLEGFMARWAGLVLEIGGGVTCLARAVLVRRERGAWLALGTAATLWALGDAYYRGALFELDSPPIPSPSDVLWLAFYPFAFTGIGLLMRARAVGVRATVWMDGLIAALAVAALAAAVVFNAVLESIGGAPIETATNLAYPLMDGLLLAFVVGGFVITGWGLDRTWLWLAAALTTFAVSDSVYLYEIAKGTYTPGGVLDAGWAVALFLVGIAAWRTRRPIRHTERSEGWRSIALPIFFGVVAIAIETYDHYARVTVLALYLTGACLLAVLGRLAMTFGQNLRVLRTSRQEAATDPLTGLGNRRRLMLDLDRALADGWPDRGCVLVLFDLNGFKLYNDSFGHPAGDALLKRLGERLGAQIGEDGSAYRMGGDEFCVLIPFPEGEPEACISRIATALCERGDAFSIDCSYGWAALPAEALDSESALRLVDQRMYAQKQGGRTSARAQSKDVLLQALVERSPALGPHLSDVADLASETARALGITGQELEHTRAAGELHDIGKVAIPDAILDKAGPLNDDEWSYIKRHSEVGERIVAAAPALAEVAKLVRSIHERYDGTGYPDGLAGDEIPLGARVVAVCDAYDAMTADRPYRRAMDPATALAELQRTAGAQFDPEAVRAFCRAHASRFTRAERRGELTAAV
jgi:diguanylate cyclase (GGDEF)-like protein